MHTCKLIVGALVLATLSPLASASEPYSVDLLAPVDPLVSRINVETNGGVVRYRMDEGSFILPVREPGPHAVSIRYWTASNTFANLAVRLEAPDSQCLLFRRADAAFHLASQRPYEDVKSPIRPAQSHEERFEVAFEYPGDYTLVLWPCPSTHRQGGDRKFRFESIELERLEPTAEGERPAAIPAGFTPARVLPLTTDLNSGIPDKLARFRSTIIQNYPIFRNHAALVDFGCNYEQIFRFVGLTNAVRYGFPASSGVEAGPGSRDLEREYPMPRKNPKEPDAAPPEPVGRFANAEGRYSNEFSYFFEPAIQAAYATNAATLKSLVDSPAGAWVDSFYIAGEQGGRYDYGATAVAAYRKFLAVKYGDIAALNAAWHTEHPSFEAVTPAKRADCVGDRALTNALDRARATANFIDFRDFCSKGYATFLRRARVQALLDHDPRRRPLAGQFANLDLSAVRWADWRPLDFEDIMRITLDGIAETFSYDVYAADDFVGAEYDLFSALGEDRKELVIREGGIHTPNAGVAARTYWTALSKGLKGFSLFMLQEGNGHPEFPKFGLTNADQTPRPKLAAYSDIMRAVAQIEPLVVGARRVRAAKPVAIYYSKTCNTLQPNPYGSIFDSAPDSFFHVYEMLRGNGREVTFVTDRQIREKRRLGEIAAIFFVDAKYVPDDVLDAVESWVEAGGHVFADFQPGAFNGHGFPSDRFMKFLRIEPERKQGVDRMKIDLNLFGYNSDAFEMIRSDRSYESTFEFFQQQGSDHPINLKAGNFMFSGFGFNKIRATGGDVVVMSQNGGPAGVVSRHGKGTAFYFAGFLGSIYGGAATQFEWRDTHSDDSPHRFLDAYLDFVGAERMAVVEGLRNKVRYKLRVESPLVDAKGNVLIGVSSYNDDDVRPFRLGVRWPAGVAAPVELLFLRNGTREVARLPFEMRGGMLFCEVPSFTTHCALVAPRDFAPIVSVRPLDAPRGVAELAEFAPGRAYRVAVRVFNPSDAALPAGAISLRLPAGWFYDRETAEVGPVAARCESDETVFTIRTPDYCAGTRVRPLNFLYESKDGRRSMPTAEVVWWRGGSSTEPRARTARPGQGGSNAEI